MPRLIDRTRAEVLGEVSDEDVQFILHHTSLEPTARALYLTPALVDQLDAAPDAPPALLRLLRHATRADESAELTWSTGSPLAVLDVALRAGRDLVVRDLRSSDPYCIFTLRDAAGVPQQTYTSSVVDSDLNPTWRDEQCAFVFDAGWDLLVELFDRDRLSADDPMGATLIDLDRVPDGSVIDDWFDLQHAKTGALHLVLTRRPLVPSDLDA